MHGACQHRWNGFVLRHNLLGGPNGPGYEDEWVRFTARGRSPLRIRVGLSLGVYSSPRHGNIVRSIWLEKYLHCASGDVLGTGCKSRSGTASRMVLHVRPRPLARAVLGLGAGSKTGS